jgi:diaminopimelate decarboxylase
VTAHAAARINPDVDARTHGKISTGKAENKFGVSLGEARRWFDTARDLAHVRLDGLHVHVGSQILSLEPFRVALERVAGLWRDLAAAGHSIDTIDVGGGLGVRYRADRDRPLELADYVQVVSGALGDFPGRLVFEPGRYLVADAGTLLTRVIRVKHGRTRSFLVVDAAMNDLMRPSLYDAWHEVIPVHSDVRSLVRYDIVGPVCESSDTFATARDLPACVPGDLLMIAGTGAYGASMASTYNSRPLLAEVLVDRSRFALIRRRQTIEELMQNELLPQEWQVP